MQFLPTWGSSSSKRTLLSTESLQHKCIEMGTSAVSEKSDLFYQDMTTYLTPPRTVREDMGEFRPAGKMVNRCEVRKRGRVREGSFLGSKENENIHFFFLSMSSCRA